MKALLATKRHAGNNCLGACRRSIKAGEVILSQKINDVSFNVSTVFWHADCVASILAGAPERRRSFDEIRQRMVETGQAFET